MQQNTYNRLLAFRSCMLHLFFLRRGKFIDHHDRTKNAYKGSIVLRTHITHRLFLVGSRIKAGHGRAEPWLPSFGYFFAIHLTQLLLSWPLARNRCQPILSSKASTLKDTYQLFVIFCSHTFSCCFLGKHVKSVAMNPKNPHKFLVVLRPQLLFLAGNDIRIHLRGSRNKSPCRCIPCQPPPNHQYSEKY